MQKLFKDRVNKEAKGSKEHWLEEIKMRNENKNEVMVTYNSNVDCDKTWKKISIASISCSLPNKSEDDVL